MKRDCWLARCCSEERGRGIRANEEHLFSGTSILQMRRKILSGVSELGKGRCARRVLI